jgi:hypothetical protein
VGHAAEAQPAGSGGSPWCSPSRASNHRSRSTSRNHTASGHPDARRGAHDCREIQQKHPSVGLPHRLLIPPLTTGFAVVAGVWISDSPRRDRADPPATSPPAIVLPERTTQSWRIRRYDSPAGAVWHHCEVAGELLPSHGRRLHPAVVRRQTQTRASRPEDELVMIFYHVRVVATCLAVRASSRRPARGLVSSATASGCSAARTMPERVGITTCTASAARRTASGSPVCT